MKHTPGPWEVADAGGYEGFKYQLEEYFVRRPEDDVAIASEVLDPDTCKPSEANARLIAAAPDLLAACKLEVIELANMAAMIDPTVTRIYMEAVYAAIAKAEALV